MKTPSWVNPFRRSAVSPAAPTGPASTPGNTSAQAKIGSSSEGGARARLSWLMPNPLQRAAKNQLSVGREGAPQRVQFAQVPLKITPIRAQQLPSTPRQSAQPIEGLMNRAAMENLNRRLGHLELAHDELKLPDNHHVVGERVATSRNLPTSFVTRAVMLGVQLPLDTKFSQQMELDIQSSINKLEARLERIGVLAPPVDYRSMSMEDLDKVMPDLAKTPMKSIQSEPDKSQLESMYDDLLRKEFDT